MGRETELFKSKETKSRSEVTGFLRQLADRIDSGQVTLSSGKGGVTLDMPGHLILEVKVEDEEKRRKGTQHSLEVELKWFDDMPAAGGLTLG